MRKHLGYSPNDSAMWKHLWVMERALANKYGETGNRAREIDLSKRIVQEAREYKDSFLLAEKLIDLAVSYDQTLSLEEKR